MQFIKKIFSEFILKIWGWSILGDFPNSDRMMIIVSPHRKRFPDVALGWLVRNVKPLPPQKFLVKYESMHTPVTGWILGKLGGISIDRKRQFTDNVVKGGYITNIVEMLKSLDRVAVVITPEGTRTQHAPWKRGFYSIAMQSNLPLIMVGFDYERKHVIISSPKKLTTNTATDLIQIKSWYEHNVLNYKPNIDIEHFY